MTSDAIEREAERALWLEPTNPLARDIHARMLLGRGERERALEEITRSVFYSPSPATHFYLASERVSGLSAQERAAVERGFEMAVAANFPDAVSGFGDYYHSLGQASKEADVYAAAAAQQSDPLLRSQYLVRAGQAFAQANQSSSAQAVLSRAIAINPLDLGAYQTLIEVYASTGQIAKITPLVRQARSQGLDAFPLYRALAQVQINAGDTSGALDSLLHAARYHPTDFMTLYYLGQLYSQRQQFDRAVMWLRRAAASNPRSADAFIALAGAQQSSYDYFDAERSYRKAMAIDPRNEGVRRAYEELQKKIQEASSNRDGSATP